MDETQHIHNQRPKSATAEKIALVAIISLMFITGKLLGGDDVQNPTVGRFQLFQATFTVLDSKNNRADKEIGVFLLDTATGKVKRYSTGLSKSGEGYEHWQDTSK